MTAVRGAGGWGLGGKGEGTKTRTDTENSRVMTRGKAGCREVEEGKEG